MTLIINLKSKPQNPKPQTLNPETPDTLIF
jgi:hypothetical protein